MWIICGISVDVLSDIQKLTTTAGSNTSEKSTTYPKEDTEMHHAQKLIIKPPRYSQFTLID